MARKFWLLSFSSAALLLLGLHPLELTWLSWFGFLPLFLLFFDEDISLRHLIPAALFVGALYYGIGLYWLLLYEVRIYLLVLLILAPTFAVYFFFLWLLTRKLRNVPIKILFKRKPQSLSRSSCAKHLYIPLAKVCLHHLEHSVVVVNNEKLWQRELI